MTDATIINRRAFVGGGIAAIALPTVPAYYPLPDGLTPAFLRGLAKDSRQKALARILEGRRHLVLGVDQTTYLIELLNAFAEIFERMAVCREPFELLESELYATERALQRKHNFTPP